MQTPELPEIKIDSEKEMKVKSILNKSNLRNKLSSGEFSSENSEIITNKFIINRGKKQVVIRKSLIQNNKGLPSLKEPLLNSIIKKKKKTKSRLKFSSNQVHLVQSFKKYNKKTKCCFFYEY